MGLCCQGSEKLCMDHSIKGNIAAHNIVKNNIMTVFIPID